MYIISGMTLINLERALRKGKTPLELGGEEIGRGVQKTAYLITTSKGYRVVVKEDTGGYCNNLKRPPSEIAKYGAKPIYQTKAGKYLIQGYCTPIKQLNRDDDVYKLWRVMYDALFSYDLHHGNCGKDDNGNLVVFDW